MIELEDRNAEVAHSGQRVYVFNEEFNPIEIEKAVKYSVMNIVFP